MKILNKLILFLAWIGIIYCVGSIILILATWTLVIFAVEIKQVLRGIGLI